MKRIQSISQLQRICVLTLIISFFAISCTRNEITLDSLLNEMTDRENIARFPDPSYTMKQFSSYDRATTQKGDSTWFANWDRSMFIRIDSVDGRKEYVMLDTDGPGAIVRFWMTFAGENSGKGIMRIYFDNEKEPSVEGTAFSILSGGQLVGEPLSSSVSDSTPYERRGHNLYLPLPYSKHCKISYESENILDAGAKTGGEAVYYNINYRSYPSNTKVKTFSHAQLKESGETVDRVQNLLDIRNSRPENTDMVTTKVDEKIPPGSQVSFRLYGSNAVRLLRMKLMADNAEQALRTTILKMTFDGKETVWCPVGDFFGTGYQIRYSNTWYSSVGTDGLLTALHVMPFKDSAEIVLENIGTDDVWISEGEISIAPWKWDNRSMHFGSSWHQFTGLNTGDMKNHEGGGGPFDINYVELSGKGVYAGDAITLFNTVNAWWGEGDEKIYVDGESFPSNIGTGTEDYYGYAWSRPEKFANHPFIAQPDGSGNSLPGYTVNTRYRGLDAMPFNESLKVDMEMWHSTGGKINFAPVTFWYTMPGGSSNIEADVSGALSKVALKRSDIIPPVLKDGKIEGENMDIIQIEGGKIHYPKSVKNGWSDNMQLFWLDGKPGNSLKLSFICREPGRYSVHALITTAPEYGKFKLKLNGKNVSGIINPYSDKLSIRSVPLGLHNLVEGNNELIVELVGYSSEDGKAFFGLDCLLLDK